jgi:hypothetical protein
MWKGNDFRLVKAIVKMVNKVKGLGLLGIGNYYRGLEITSHGVIKRVAHRSVEQSKQPVDIQA